jgi:hypothetical protein
MSLPLLTPEQYGRETSLDSPEIYALDPFESEADHLLRSSSFHGRSRWRAYLGALFGLPLRLISTSHAGKANQRRPTRLLNRRLTLVLRFGLGLVLGLLLITGIFRPSYTYLPEHYETLRKRVVDSQNPGRGNPNNEQIFISCALYDKNGHLAGGPWGQSLIDLVDILGPDNVFLSIYENDSGEAGQNALMELKSKVACEREIISELHVPPDPFPSIVLPDGSKQHKRIPYLAEMRNRALRSIDKFTGRTFHKVLILNDVFFNPVDVAQLLFSTNKGVDGKADYVAACAIDFINAFKFYDTFASRDIDGFSMGVPFFPWFSSAGQGRSRQDVLSQTDAVRVKSCWGGMVAFDARFLQSTESEVPDGFQEIGAHTISPAKPEKVSAPIRFRAEPEIFFDACECCLLHADIQRVANSAQPREDSGIYLNPFVRVAYDPVTLSWLTFTRRFERLYSIPHWLVNTLARMPTYNPHRTVEEGEFFQEEVWKADSTVTGGGFWQIENRTARNGLFCGVREMQILLQKQRTEDKNWMNTRIPSGGQLW